jgi:hypothetical protein
MAQTICSCVRSRSVPIAIAAPNTPTLPVLCQPAV